VNGTIPKSWLDVSIYIALHTQPLDSDRHVTVKASLGLRCLSILFSCDHKRWSASLYFDASPPHHHLQNKQSSFLAGVLRALYPYEHFYDGATVSIFVPSKTLVQSIICPPASLAFFFTLADLHRMVQQHLLAEVLIAHDAVLSLHTEPASLHIDQTGNRFPVRTRTQLTVLLRFSLHTLLTIFRTLSHLSLSHFVFLYHFVVVTGLGGTNLYPRICSSQCQISKPCLHVLLSFSRSRPPETRRSS